MTRFVMPNVVATLLVCTGFLTGADAWYLMMGYNLYAPTLGEPLSNVTPEKCWEACRNTPGCNSAAYFMTEMKCWPKSAFPNKAVKTDKQYLAVISPGKPNFAADTPKSRFTPPDVEDSDAYVENLMDGVDEREERKEKMEDEEAMIEMRQVNQFEDRDIDVDYDYQSSNAVNTGRSDKERMAEKERMEDREAMDEMRQVDEYENDKSFRTSKNVAYDYASQEAGGVTKRQKSMQEERSERKEMDNQEKEEIKEVKEMLRNVEAMEEMKEQDLAVSEDEYQSELSSDRDSTDPMDDMDEEVDEDERSGDVQFRNIDQMEQFEEVDQGQESNTIRSRVVKTGMTVEDESPSRISGAQGPGSPKGYVANFFVHLPYAFRGRRLTMTHTNLGRGFRNIQECQNACYDTFQNRCIYAQYKVNDACWISEECDGPKCSTVQDVNAPGRDYNRVNCKNPQYVRMWEASDAPPSEKGLIPCTNMNDEGRVTSTINDMGFSTKGGNGR